MIHDRTFDEDVLEASRYASYRIVYIFAVSEKSIIQQTYPVDEVSTYKHCHAPYYKLPGLRLLPLACGGDVIGGGYFVRPPHPVGRRSSTLDLAAWYSMLSG